MTRELTNEQRERLQQIRGGCRTSKASELGDVIAILESDQAFLLSLLDSDSQAAAPRWTKEWPNVNGGVYWRRFAGYARPTEPELCVLNGDYLDSFGGASTMSIPSNGIAEQWEFLGPITPNSETSAATLMRDKCVEKVKELIEQWAAPDSDLGDEVSGFRIDAANDIVEALGRLTLQRCVLCSHAEGLREPEGHCVICGCNCQFATDSSLTLDQLKPGEI